MDKSTSTATKTQKKALRKPPSLLTNFRALEGTWVHVDDVGECQTCTRRVTIRSATTLRVDVSSDSNNRQTLELEL
jgi:hypothetical protein